MTTRRGQHGGVWTESLVDQLKQLISAGECSASQIGIQLGVNRSQVLGKCHRMGLPLVGKDKARRKAYQSHKAKSIKLKAQAKAKAENKPAWTPAIEPLPLPQIDDVARKPMSALDEQDCRFPVGNPGEPGFGFCAAGRVQGLPYCPQHAARCYAPIIPKSKTKNAPDRSDVRTLKVSDLVSAGE